MERKFVLKETFDDFLDSLLHTPIATDTSEHIGIMWSIEATRRSKNTEFRLISEQSSDSNLWSVDAEYQFSLISEAGGNAKQRKRLTTVRLNDVFSCRALKGQLLTVNSSEVNQYVVDNKLTVVCEVSIIKTRGIREKRKQTFDEHIDKMTDVIFEVGDRKFYASKPILANLSPYFKAMFYNNFEETKARVKIDDVEPEDFENLLAFFHQAPVDINAGNVSRMLKAADTYDVEALTKACELFLKKSRQIPVQERLKLSEDFNLPDLQDSCIESFKSRQNMAQQLENIDEMGELTVKALLKKALAFRT